MIVDMDENGVNEPLAYQASDSISLENTLLNMQSEMHHIRKELSSMQDRYKSMSQAIAAFDFVQTQSDEQREWKKIAMTLLEKI